MKSRTRILILDDERIVCERLKPALEKIGFYVETFTESQAAVDRLAEATFDVLITDLKMRQPDGMEVMRFAKENYPAIKVIIITGYATVDNSCEAMRSGAEDFIAKPFKISKLLDLVVRLASPDHDPTGPSLTR
ncbi:MAG: response regulator [bacterium]|nr:response regulator [bacterium]